MRNIYVYVYIIYYATTWLFFVSLLLFYGYLLYFTRDIWSGFLARVWGETFASIYRARNVSAQFSLCNKSILSAKVNTISKIAVLEIILLAIRNAEGDY